MQIKKSPNKTQEASRKALKPKEAAFMCRLARPVFFVGFMGSGKTSTARRLARMCHIVSIDMDAYIERKEEKRVSAIFREQGEEAFRAMETAVLEELALGEPRLISCGGGVVLSPKNREILKEKGFVVYLQVSASEAFSRISDPTSRPVLKDKDNAYKINEMRIPYYEEVADASIDTSGKNIGRITYEVREILQKERLLWREPK